MTALKEQDKGFQYYEEDHHHHHKESYNYKYCSREECEERQTLGQVNELESTIETCRLNQNRRVLDPRYAVPKYRRSAAAGGVSDYGSRSRSSSKHDDGDSSSRSSSRRRSASQLSSTLDHLIFVMAYRRASEQHPQVEDVSTVLLFLIDRLRAVQADATRLLSSSSSSSSSLAADRPLPATFHLKLLRLLIWIRFCWDVHTVASSTNSSNSSSSNKNSNNVDSLTPRTIQTMISTSIEMYWGMREHDGCSGIHNNNGDGDDSDDEVMCYSTMIQISTMSLMEICINNGSSLSSSSMSLDDGGNWNRLLFDFNKRQEQLSTKMKNQKRLSLNEKNSFPLWHEALKVASYASRQEFYYIFHAFVHIKNFSVLARCCCAQTLFAWRYRTVQQYNVTFGKNEAINDLQHLLGIHDDDWTINYAKEFGDSLPVSLDNSVDDHSIEVTMKAMSIPNLDIQKASFQDESCSKERLRSTRRWIFGEFYNKKEVDGLSPSGIQRMIESGKCTPTESTRGKSAVSDKVDHDEIKQPPVMSSLQQQLSQLSMNGSRPVIHNQFQRQNTDSKKKKSRARTKCKFYSLGECRYGDKCRFDHSK